MGTATSYGTQGTENAGTFTSRLYRPDGTKTGTVTCHGYQGRATDWIATPVPAVNRLAQSGYPVTLPDLGGDLWGNDTAQTKIGDARAYLQGSAGAKAGKIWLLGYSMGALAALNWARANPTLVAAIVLVEAVIDLADFHDHNASYVASIEAAYGGTAGYTAAVAAHNPATHATDLAGIPIDYWYSNGDTLIPTAPMMTFCSALGITPRAIAGDPTHANAPLALDGAAVFSFLTAHP